MCEAWASFGLINIMYYGGRDYIVDQKSCPQKISERSVRIKELGIVVHV